MPRCPGGKLRFIGLAALIIGCESTKGSTARDAAVESTDSPVEAEATAPLTCPEEHETEGPVLSFANDLMPVFGRSCAFVGCHDAQSRLAGLYLGPNFTEGAPNEMTTGTVYDGLLSRSTTAPDLLRVDPGAPDSSFLLLKVDGCQNVLGLACTGPAARSPCGDRMPALSPPLARGDRDLFARWIAQGAAPP